MSGKGIKHGASIRHRSKQKRGGQLPEDDGLDRSDSQGLALLFDAYLENRATLNYSATTIEGFKKYLRLFLQWCQERDLLKPESITKPILESYQRHLYRYRKQNGKPLSVTSQRHHLGSVQGFFKWLCKTNVLLSNPASELDMPRAEKRLPVLPLSIREVELVLSQPDISDPLGVRDRALLELLYSTAMRRRELVNLTISDVDFERQLVVVRQGKGKKDRVLPVGERALNWMQRYFDEVRSLLLVNMHENTFFLSSYGEAFNVDFITRQVGKYIDKADIGKRGSCHLLRHTCAGHMLDNGADIRFIQQLLGHASLKTTQVYTEVSIHQLQKVHALTHPANKGTEH